MPVEVALLASPPQVLQMEQAHIQSLGGCDCAILLFVFLNDFLIPHQWVAGLHSRQTWRSGRLPSRNRCYSVLCLWCPLAPVTACRMILNQLAMRQAIRFELTAQRGVCLFVCFCGREVKMPSRMQDFISVGTLSYSKSREVSFMRNEGHLCPLQYLLICLQAASKLCRN